MCSSLLQACKPDLLFSPHTPHQEDPEVDISFIGCSWLIIYHIGAAQKLLEAGQIKPGKGLKRGDTTLSLPCLSFPLVYAGVTIVGGSSSGSLVATAVASGVDLNKLKQLVIDMANDSQQRLVMTLFLTLCCCCCPVIILTHTSIFSNTMFCITES